MEEKINSLYTVDNLVVLSFLIVLWTSVLFILKEVLGISPDSVFRAVAITSGISVLAALTSTSIALCLHLRRNKVTLYTEDIMNSKDFKG